MKALEIARVSLVRLFRDRVGLFFIFLLPSIIIILLGAMYGGRTAPRLGIAMADSGPLGAELVALIEGGAVDLEMRTYGSEAEVRDAVRAGTVELAIIVPAGYDDAIRAGQAATVTVVGRRGGQMAVQEAVAAAVAEQSARLGAARLAERETGVAFETALRAAADLGASMPGVSVPVTDVGSRTFPADIGPFSLGAQSQLVLFMFLTSMAAATQLILSRQLGVTRRMMATATSPRAIVAGETLGRFSVAMVQGLYIVAISALVFGVRWGDPFVASLLIISFALVGTGVALVIGVFGRNADQAGTLGVFVGMVSGALGGAMVPLELLGQPMRTIAHLTPHAWALDGFRAIIFRQGGLPDVLPSLAVLAAFALAACGLAVWRFRRMLGGS